MPVLIIRFFQNQTKIFIFGYFLVLFFLFTSIAHAATFNVSLNDTNGLIEAINQSNLNSEADEINLFPESTYSLSQKNNDLFSKNGLPVINSEIVINGNNSTLIRHSSENFRIITLIATGKLTINNLIIKDGYDDDRIDNFGGGGILNFGGNLIINDSSIANNQTEWGGGGGIWIGENSPTKIINTKINNNTVGPDGSGGGILKRGSGIMEIINSEIFDNFAQNIGGAIYSGNGLNGSSGELVKINDTKITNNSAGNDGGAIFNFSGNFNINNSCFSGNSATSIFNYSTNYLNITNNYWGAVDGPSVIGPGSGDSIEGNVNYLPFQASCLSPSPSPSPSPEPSLLPSPMPSPQPTKIPVIILPGFGGSWNTQAIISGGDEGVWKKTPFVKVYDNLKQTFLNAGYTEGQNYFEFYYDWRKPLDNLADQLKNYLETIVLPGKPEPTKINFIGHSMGGLVARSYGQKYGTDKINQLVTAGSPHQGAITPWLLWSGAETNDHWSFSWLGLQLYLQLQKNKFGSPVAAIQNLNPSLLDLTPTFDFAKKNNLTMPINTMSFTNDYLAGLNIGLTPNLKNTLNIVYGETDGNTIEWVNLGERTLADKLLGKWSDGRPIDYLFTSQGDLTVLTKSAIINEISSIATISGNHSEIVSETDGIQSILNELELTGTVPSTATESTRRNPALFFFLHSPAQIKVTSAEGLEAGYGSAGNLPDAIYSEEDKLLLIQNALSDYYQTEIIGQGDGIYGLEIGQLTDESDNWFNIENNINLGESDFFKVDLSQVKPANPLELTIYQLNKIKGSSSSKKSIKKIEEIIRKLNLQRQNGLLDIIDDIYSLDFKVSELDKAGKWLIETIEEPVKDRLKILTKLITAEEIKTSEKFLESMKNKIDQKINGENPEIGARLELAEEYLVKAKADFEKGLYRRARAERKIVKIILHKLL